jgi:hypothetical protein
MSGQHKITREIPWTRPRISLTTYTGGADDAPAGQVPTSIGSNGQVAWGSNVATITVNGTTLVRGPYVNIANGSNTTVTVDQVGSFASNTIRIHATGGGSVSFGSNSNQVSYANAPGASSDASRADHVHLGVTSVSHSSNTYSGPVILAPGANVGITSPVSGTFTIHSTATGGGGGGGGSGNVIAQTGNVEIPGLAGSPDRIPASPDADDDEFDTTTTGVPSGWTATANTPDADDTNTTAKSAYYTRDTGGAGDTLQGAIMAAPSIPYTVTARIMGTRYRPDNSTHYSGPALVIADNSDLNGKVVVLMNIWNGGGTIQQINISRYSTGIPGGGGSASGGAAVANINSFNAYFLRAVVTAANNISYYASNDGLAWTLVSSGNNYLSNATYIMLGTFAILTVAEAYWDWIRFT